MFDISISLPNLRCERGWVSLIRAAGLYPCRIVLLELYTHGGLRMRKAKELVGVVLMSQVNPLEAKEPWYLQMQTVPASLLMRSSGYPVGFPGS